MTCSSLTKIIRGLGLPKPAGKKSAKQHAADDTVEDMDIDAGTEPASSHAGNAKQIWAQCTMIINNLAGLLLHFGMRDQPDLLRNIVDALVELTRQSMTGSSVSASQKRLRSVPDHVMLGWHALHL